MGELYNGIPVKFKIGDEDTYNNLATKDKGTMYFVTDADDNKRIYIGDQCYNLTVITDLENGVVSDKTVYSSEAVKLGLNSKVSMCTVDTSDSETLPTTVNIRNNYEYRFPNLTGATGIQVDVTNDYVHYLFYCSIILHKIISSDSVAEFVTVPSGSTTEIKFLNGDVNLDGMDTLELLFFTNGLDICCIASTYKHEAEGE